MPLRSTPASATQGLGIHRELLHRLSPCDNNPEPRSLPAMLSTGILCCFASWPLCGPSSPEPSPPSWAASSEARSQGAKINLLSLSLHHQVLVAVTQKYLAGALLLPLQFKELFLRQGLISKAGFKPLCSKGHVTLLIFLPPLPMCVTP